MGVSAPGCGRATGGRWLAGRLCARLRGCLWPAVLHRPQTSLATAAVPALLEALRCLALFTGNRKRAHKAVTSMRGPPHSPQVLSRRCALPVSPQSSWNLPGARQGGQDASRMRSGVATAADRGRGEEAVLGLRLRQGGLAARQQACIACTWARCGQAPRMAVGSAARTHDGRSRGLPACPGTQSPGCRSARRSAAGRATEWRAGRTSTCTRRSARLLLQVWQPGLQARQLALRGCKGLLRAGLAGTACAAPVVRPALRSCSASAMRLRRGPPAGGGASAGALMAPLPSVRGRAARSAQRGCWRPRGLLPRPAPTWARDQAFGAQRAQHAQAACRSLAGWARVWGRACSRMGRATHRTWAPAAARQRTGSSTALRAEPGRAPSAAPMARCGASQRSPPCPSRAGPDPTGACVAPIGAAHPRRRPARGPAAVPLSAAAGQLPRARRCRSDGAAPPPWATGAAPAAAHGTCGVQEGYSGQGAKQGALSILMK